MIYKRVKKNADFQRIFSRGKRGFSSRVTLLYLPAERFSMGVCVSKKHGNAVKRNRVKRILRDIFRLHEGEIKKNYSFLLIPKAAETYDFHELEKDFLYILRKNALLEEKGEEK